MNRWAAYSLFGPMRSSTSQEHKEYEKMLKKYSIPFERSVFNMGDIEIDYCDICNTKTQVQRRYYHYNIACECCVGNHFEIVKYCSNCTPHPPQRISVIVLPYDDQE